MDVTNVVEIVCPVCTKRGHATVEALKGHLPYPAWPTLMLELDPYEAANLLFHMQRVWAGAYLLPGPGDWQGQIPQKLMVAMREGGTLFTTHRPNAGGEFPFTPEGGNS